MRLIAGLSLAVRLKFIRLCFWLSKRMVTHGADLGAWAAQRLRAMERDF
ncbi:hypothetical protein [Bradyrhizobium sp. RT3a]